VRGLHLRRSVVCIKKSLMMFPEIIAVCPEIMQNTLSTLHGKNVQFLGAL
jgi:accessory gene regulator protein AgrB